MPYSPGITDRSGEIRAQGMLQGGMGLLGGIEKGMEELKLQKEKEKSNQATIKAADLMSKGLGAVAGQLGPEYQAALQELQKVLADTSISSDKKSQIAKTSLDGITELLGTGVKLKQLNQQAEHQKAIQELQRQRASQGAAPTEAQRNTEAIIQAEINSGTLNPQDQGSLSKRRAELLALGGRSERDGQPYQGLGPVQNPDGSYGGQLVLNQRTGKVEVRQPEGSQQGEAQGAPQQQGAVRPTTNTGLNRAVLSGDQFLKLRGQLTEDEIGLEKLSRYFKNVGTASQGIDTIADRFSMAASTMFGKGDLTQEQIALARSQGQLQGLIGASRLEVLGGGVLTEQDAARIIAYLGGDIGMLRNKELVKKAVAEIYQDKVKRYQRGLKDYNLQVKNKYGSEGYEEATPLELDETLLPSAAPAEKAPVDVIKSQIEELRKKIEEIKGKQ